MTAVVTLLGVTNKIMIREVYLNTLFAALIIELIVVVVALYKTTDFFAEESFQRYVKPNQQEYIWNEANIRFSYPRIGCLLILKERKVGLVI